jgi:hypothetical protein
VCGSASAAYRAAVVEEGGIRRLVAAMRTFPDRANLILHACSCLLNLALANGTANQLDLSKRSVRLF